MSSYTLIVGNRKGECYFPLIVSVGYILITLFLSVAGPIEYYSEAYNKPLSVLYVVTVTVFLSLGYYIGLSIRIPQTKSTVVPFGKSRTQYLISVSQNVALISIALEFAYLLTIGRFSFSLSSVGSTYLDVDRTGSANIITIFRFCTAFFRTAALSLGFCYFQELSQVRRIKTVICTIGVLAIYLFGYGTQSGIGYLFIYIVLAVFTNMIRNGSTIKKRTIFLVIILGVIVLFLFSYMQYKRYELVGINASNYRYFSTGEYGYNTNHIIFKLFGEKLGFGLSTILGSYMSLGYYGLSLCLQLPFEWTYGVGHSYAITQLLEKAGVTGILEKTYVMRMQDQFGRNGLSAWNSIFPWLASDCTWGGVLFVFLVIGLVLGFTWKDVLLHRNSFSYLLFTTLMILVFFVPANNAIVHGYDNLISTYSIIIGWILFRKRYEYE